MQTHTEDILAHLADKRGKTLDGTHFKVGQAVSYMGGMWRIWDHEAYGSTSRLVLWNGKTAFCNGVPVDVPVAV
jgi:hypothetical protein